MSDNELRVGVTVSPDGAERGSAQAAAAINSAAESIQRSMQAMAQSMAANTQAVANNTNQMAAAMQNAANRGANAMNRVGHAGTGVRREFIVLAHEISQGQWTRFGGSLLVLGERMDILRYLATPTGVAVGAMATVFAAAAIAALQGAMQINALNKALILSGNYAGLNTDRFMAMSRAISASVGGGVISAQKALSATAATGVFGPQSIQAVTAVVDKIAQLSGQTAEKVTAEFAKMKNGVSKWAETSEVAYNNLTVADQQYIRSLEQHGKAQEAMAYAADKINDKLGQTAQQLGYLPGLLMKAKEGWQEFWNAAMDVGRPKGPAEKIKDLNRQIQQNQDFAGVPLIGSLYQHNIDNLHKQIDAQQELLNLQTKAQAAEDAKNETMRKARDADILANRLREQAGGPEETARKINEYRTAIQRLTDAKKLDASVQVPSKAEQDRVEAMIRRKNDKGATPSPGAAFSVARAQQQAQLALLQDSLKTEEKVLQESYRNREITTVEYYNRQRELIQQNAKLEMQARQQALSEAQSAAGLARTGSQREEAQAKIITVQGQINLLRQQEANQLKALAAEQERVATQEQKQLDTIKAETAERIKLAEVQTKLEATSGLTSKEAGGKTQVEILQKQRELENERYQITLEGLRRRMQIEGQSPVEIARINSQIEIEQAQHEQKLRQIGVEQSKAMQQPYQQAADAMKGSFENLFNSLGDRTKSMKQKFADFFDSIMKGLANIGSNLIFSALFGGGSGAGGIGGGGGVFGGLINGIIGSVAKYDVGTDYVPKTGLAMIHQGERIITAKDNSSGNYGKGMNVVNNFHLSGPVDNRTQSQIASTAYSGAYRAMLRNK